MTKRFIGYAEMKAKLGVSRTQIGRMVDDGKLPVNRRWIFTPDRRAIETPLVDGLERVGDLSCVA